jgi:hypothetical protein
LELSAILHYGLGLVFQKPLERQRRVQHEITHRR